MLKNKDSEGIKKIECENIDNQVLYEQVINLLLEINKNSFSVHKNKEVYNKEKKIIEKVKKKVIYQSPDKAGNELPDEVASLLLKINESTILDSAVKKTAKGQTDIIKPVIHLSEFKKDLPEEIKNLLLRYSDKAMILPVLQPEGSLTVSAERTEIIAVNQVQTGLAEIFPAEADEKEVPVPVMTAFAPGISDTKEYSFDDKIGLFKHFKISEEGSFLGMVIARTNKKQVIEKMKMYIDSATVINEKDSIFSFSNISLNIYFDELDFISEFEFGEGFKGSTAKGLRIGDSLQKAQEIYGKPKMKTAKGAIWDKVKIFYNENFITKIKVG